MKKAEIVKKKVGRPRKEEVPKEEVKEIQTKYLYAAKLFAKGWSRNKVSEDLQATYNVSQSTAARYINEAYRIIKEKNDNLIKNLRQVQLSRLETLLDIAMDKKDIRSAVEVLKTINSMFGLNTPETIVAIQNNEVKFEFGNPIINKENVEIN